MTVVMGFDCGSLKTGVALMRMDESDEWEMLHVELLRLRAKDTFAARIGQLGKRVREVLAKWNPDHVIIEDLKFNKHARNLSSMGKVAMAIGAVMSEVARAGYEPVLITAKTARSRVKAKDKDGARARMNERFSDDLADLGYPDGVPKAHEDISDAMVLCYAASAEVRRQQAASED